MATSGKRDQRILIGYRYDPAGEKAFLAAVQRQQVAIKAQANNTRTLNSALEGNEQATRSATSVLRQWEQTSDASADAQRRIARAAAEANEELREQVNAADRAAAANERAARAASGSIGGAGRSAVAGGLDNIDRVGQFGGQIASGLGNSDAANAAGLLGDLAGALGSFNPAVIAGTAGVVGLGIVLGDITQRLEAARQAGQLYADGLLNTANLIASGATSSEVRALRDADERSAAAIRQQISPLDSLVDDLTGTQETIADIVADINNVSVSGEEFTGQLALLEEQFNRAIDSESQLEARIRGVLDIEDEQIDVLVAARESLALANTEIKRLDDSVESYNQTLQSGVLAANDAAAAEAERKRIFNQEAVAAATARAAETEQKLAMAREVEERAAAELLAVKEATAAREQQLIDDTRAKYIASLAAVARARDEQVSAQQAVVEAQAAGARRIAELEAEQLQARQAAAAQYAIDAARAEEDLRATLIKIQRDASFSLAQAVGERDASSFVQARRARDRELEDAQEAADKEGRRARENFNRQLQQAERANQQRLAQERAAANAEINTRGQALSAINQRVQQALQAQNAIYDTGLQNTLSLTNNFVSRVQGQFARLGSSVPKAGPPMTTPIKNAPAGASTAIFNIQGAAQRTIQTTSRASALAVLQSVMAAAGYR